VTDSGLLLGRHVYEHLGIRSTRDDGDTGVGEMALRADHRCADGLRVAPLGLLLEQCCFQPVAGELACVPTDLAIAVHDDGRGIEAVSASTRVLRRGRSHLVTEGRIFDRDDPGRIVATGSLAWAILGTTDEGLDAEPAGGTAAPLADLPTAIGIEQPEPGRAVLAAVRPEIEGPGGVLHAGVLQVLAEEAARSAARGGVVRAIVIRFLAAGRCGPFLAMARRTAPDEVEVVIIDAGKGEGDHLIGFAHTVVR
jgi:acyl-coenzyme A thioesterase PaaI-like protein